MHQFNHKRNSFIWAEEFCLDEFSLNVKLMMNNTISIIRIMVEQWFPLILTIIDDGAEQHNYCNLMVMMTTENKDIGVGINDGKDHAGTLNGVLHAAMLGKNSVWKWKKVSGGNRNLRIRCMWMVICHVDLMTVDIRELAFELHFPETVFSLLMSTWQWLDNEKMWKRGNGKCGNVENAKKWKTQWLDVFIIIVEVKVLSGWFRLAPLVFEIPLNVIVREHFSALTNRLIFSPILQSSIV